MKISTNYSRSDWKKAIPYLSIRVGLTVLCYYVLVFYAILPFLDVLTKSLDWFKGDIVESYANTVVNPIGFDQWSIGFFVFMAAFGLGFISLLRIIIFWDDYFDRIYKRFADLPMMKLVIFNNGKPVRLRKWMKKQRKSWNCQ